MANRRIADYVRYGGNVAWKLLYFVLGRNENLPSFCTRGPRKEKLTVKDEAAAPDLACDFVARLGEYRRGSWKQANCQRPIVRVENLIVNCDLRLVRVV